MDIRGETQTDTVDFVKSVHRLGFVFWVSVAYSLWSQLVEQCHVKGQVSSVSLGNCRPPPVPVQDLKFSALGAHEHAPSSPLSLAGAVFLLSSVLIEHQQRPFVECIDFPCLYLP